MSTDSITRQSFDKYIITWWWPGLLVALWSRSTELLYVGPG